MIPYNLKAAYLFHRARNGRISGRFGFSNIATDARSALELARADVAAGVERCAPCKPWRRPADCPTVFFETENDAARAGFRFVGFADEISRSIGHKGWFTDRDLQDDTFRGAVFQLATGPRGLARFAHGYEELFNGGFVVQISGRGAVDQERIADRWAFESRRDLGPAVDAAYSADSLAERAAEDECEYHEQWHARQAYEDHGDEIAQIKARIIALLQERRRIKALIPIGEAPAMCEAIRDKVRSALRTIWSLREQRGRLASDYDDTAGWADF